MSILGGGPTQHEKIIETMGGNTTVAGSFVKSIDWSTSARVSTKFKQSPRRLLTLISTNNVIFAV